MAEKNTSASRLVRRNLSPRGPIQKPKNRRKGTGDWRKTESKKTRNTFGCWHCAIWISSKGWDGSNPIAESHLLFTFGKLLSRSNGEPRRNFESIVPASEITSELHASMLGFQAMVRNVWIQIWWPPFPRECLLAFFAQTEHPYYMSALVKTPSCLDLLHEQGYRAFALSQQGVRKSGCDDDDDVHTQGFILRVWKRTRWSAFCMAYIC